MNELSATSTSPWTATEKILFRFCFVFFSLYIIFENNNAFPFWRVPGFLQSGLESLIPWIGEKILGISYKVSLQESGSGDTTFINIMVLCFLVTASVTTVVWSLIDRKRISYAKMYYWFTVVLRYYIALMLFGYGMVKIFKLQFPYPDIYRMSEPFGKSSPMGLAWTFFGYSKGYNWFVGIAEVLSLLLLFRRTLTLGLIITLMTTLNIMAVNFFFDVPVKLLSTVLVLMTLFLLARDLKHIFTFFLTDNPVNLPVIAPPKIERKWLRILKHSFKFILIVYTTVWAVVQISAVESRDEAPKPDWYGLFEINEVIHFNDTISEPHAKVFPWKQIVFSRTNVTYVRMMDDSIGKYSLRIFTPDTTMSFVPAEQKFKKNKHVFKYDFSDSANIRLRGNLNGDSVLFVLHKIAGDESDFRLDSTGFHWISDKPNNR